MSYNFVDTKPKVVSDLKEFTKVIADSNIQVKRLDFADREMRLTDFSDLPGVNDIFDQFTKQLLPLPSLAETLNDLQAEFNALKLEAKDTGQSDQPILKVDLAWTLQQYYN